MVEKPNFGVSFSVKQCRNFKIDGKTCLQWLIKDMDFHLFRLMSYWDEIEPKRGELNFKDLDWQVDMIAKAVGSISLCLGIRQPRWPESHWPDWAWELPKAERDAALQDFITAVVKRYKDRACIKSYQLENEALLADFGRRNEVDRQRLKKEFNLVKQLDPKRPIIMTTSTSWGIPLRQPIPDIVGFSYYQKLYNSKKQTYSKPFHKPWLHRFRAGLIRLIWRKPSFIHELQLEPWGPKNVWDMTTQQQSESMGLEQIKANILAARKTGLSPIHLWGGEWWFWLHKQDNDVVPQTVIVSLADSS